MQQEIYSVSQINSYVKNLMEQDSFLSSVCVRGELSNYKIHPTGHHYFTIKDTESSLRCVMFRGSAARLRFRPESGMKVLITGRISVFPRDGSYQLYAVTMIPEGAGDLAVAFEQLKQRLWQEGLFDPSHKKPLPEYPHRIALITAASGAAVRDMLRILGKRYPLSKVLILSVRVQGPEAPAELCGAIRYVNRHGLADLIITGRGGGSMEDLWAFNDERLARTIYESEIPVISAVGHEPDVTISDFVADLRAATPSNAAELAAPDREELREKLYVCRDRMGEVLRRRLQVERQRLEGLRTKRVLQSPMNYIQDLRMLLEYHHQKLSAVSVRVLEEKKRRFLHCSARLDAMSPLKVLGRGYSVTRTEQGELVTCANQLALGEQIKVSFRQGEVTAQVIEVREEQYE